MDVSNIGVFFLVAMAVLLVIMVVAIGFGDSVV
jgi:hypothetical protein